MTAPLVRTVLGDVDAGSLGVTDAHEHLFFRLPLLPGQQLEDRTAAEAEARAFSAAGGRTVVQWTPRGLGRRRTELAEIAAATGLNIVSATGRHRRVHYGDTDAEADVDLLSRAFVDDLTAAATPSGLVKVGTGYRHLDRFERTSLEAAAAAHAATGAPIGIHLELGTAGDLVLDVLTGAGVPVDSIILGHAGRNPDDGYLRELASSGAYLCFDGPSRANHQTDWRTPAAIAGLVEHEHLAQLLVGGDSTTAAARSVNAGPGLPGLLTTFAASVRQLVGGQAWTRITTVNPARAFALRRA